AVGRVDRREEIDGDVLERGIDERVRFARPQELDRVEEALRRGELARARVLLHDSCQRRLRGVLDPVARRDALDAPEADAERSVRVGWNEPAGLREDRLHEDRKEPRAVAFTSLALVPEPLLERLERRDQIDERVPGSTELLHRSIEHREPRVEIEELRARVETVEERVRRLGGVRLAHARRKSG